LCRVSPATTPPAESSATTTSPDCHRIAAGEYYCVAVEVNGAKQLYLAIELVRGMLNTNAIPQFREQRTAREASS